jgi:hypothetical protein
MSAGSKADVTLLNFNVRFTPESGHPMRHSECLLWAKSRHQPAFDWPFIACLWLGREPRLAAAQEIAAFGSKAAIRCLVE